MTVLIEQSWVTGYVDSGVLYRGLLHVQLTQTHFTVWNMLLDKPLFVAEVNELSSVKQVRNIFEFGIEVYCYESEVKFLTRKYKEWSRHFETLGVKVISPGGWLDFP